MLLVNSRFSDAKVMEWDNPSAMVLLSFSMPNLSLKQWLLQAEKFEIPVYIRGLYKNSLIETQKKLSLLSNSNALNSLAIDPRFFEYFEITKVPVLILCKEKGKCDLVYGDVNLKSGLMFASTHSKYSRSYSEKILNKGRSDSE